MKQLPLLALVGPTASGKTALGLALAQELGAEIISVDSQQVYRGLDVGTAKPSRAEQALVPHHLIDILQPDQAYNAGQFAQDAQQAAQEISQRGHLALALGGSYLYLKALVEGIIQVPAIDPAIKTQISSWLQQEGLGYCYARLQELAPSSAERLHPHDVSRIARALEVVLQTGQPLETFHEQTPWQPRQEFRLLTLAIDWPREELYQRINQRVLLMVEQGLLSEVQRLMDQGYGPHCVALQSIGYKQALAHLAGEISLEEMTSQIQQMSRRYAKKQMTWLRKNQEVQWVAPSVDPQALAAQVRRDLAWKGGKS